MGLVVLFVGSAYVASCVEQFAGQNAAKAALVALLIIGLIIEYAAHRILKTIKDVMDIKEKKS